MLVVVISGPGGAGKGTIARALADRDDRISLSRSWTTRSRRVDDAEDAYLFVSRTDFEARRDFGGFLEWNEFLGQLYGTPFPDADGLDLLLEIDVAGGRQVLEHHSEALCLFVDAPSDIELRRRLRSRGDSSELADQRVLEAARERAEAEALGYTRIINDDLMATIAEIENLIEEARSDS